MIKWFSSTSIVKDSFSIFIHLRIFHSFFDIINACSIKYWSCNMNT